MHLENIYAVISGVRRDESSITFCASRPKGTTTKQRHDETITKQRRNNSERYSNIISRKNNKLKPSFLSPSGVENKFQT